MDENSYQIAEQIVQLHQKAYAVYLPLVEDVCSRIVPEDELKLPSSKPLAVGAMTREQLDAELQKGVDSIKAGKVYSADEVDATLAKEFGI